MQANTFFCAEKRWATVEYNVDAYFKNMMNNKSSKNAQKYAFILPA